MALFSGIREPQLSSEWGHGSHCGRDIHSERAQSKGPSSSSRETHSSSEISLPLVQENSIWSWSVQAEGCVWCVRACVCVCTCVGPLFLVEFSKTEVSLFSTFFSLLCPRPANSKGFSLSCHPMWHPLTSTIVQRAMSPSWNPGWRDYIPSCSREPGGTERGCSKLSLSATGCCCPSISLFIWGPFSNSLGMITPKGLFKMYSFRLQL